MLEEAIIYGKLGWRVFPVIGKVPAIKGWQEAASTDSRKITQLFQNKNTGIGLATGKASGVTVVDIDNKNGVNGFRTLDAMGIEMPITVCVLTPSGGRQYYFKYCPEIKNHVGALGEGSGVDIRNDGGLVILPPSIHPNGNPYEWLLDQGPNDMALAAFPVALLKEINGRAKPQGQAFELPEKIQSGQRNDTLFKYACKLRTAGMERPEIEAAVSVLNRERCIDPVKIEEVQAIVESACNYDKGAVTISNTGKVKKTLLNIIGIFSSDPTLNGVFYYNLFTKAILYSRSPLWSGEIKQEKRLDDDDLLFLKEYIANTHRVEVQTNLIQEAVFIHAHKNAKHPVRDYLNSLKWDGVNRLRLWLSRAAGVIDNLYTGSVGTKTLIAAVARVFVPGIKFDYMLILEGNQGLGKSTLVKTLAGEWFSTVTITDKDKDTVDIMRTAWIIEVEEMVCFRREDLEHIKAFLSRPVDKVRLAYRRNSEDFPRQSIFIGTINPSGDRDYLRDQTGNRRFWPVMCTRPVDQKWLAENRDQLFAEAVVRFKAGEKLWIDDPNVIDLVETEQEIRQQKDIWTLPIYQFVSNRFDEISANEILEKCLQIPIGRATKADQTRIGAVMKHLGWNRHFSKKSGCSIYRSPSFQEVLETNYPWDSGHT